MRWRGRSSSAAWQAASTIVGRVEVALVCGASMPRRWREWTTLTLRACGRFLRQDRRAARSGAKTREGVVPDAAAWRGCRRRHHRALTQVRGIGRWTVEMMLMFRLAALTCCRCTTWRAQGRAGSAQAGRAAQAAGTGGGGRALASVPHLGQFLSMAHRGCSGPGRAGEAIAGLSMADLPTSSWPPCWPPPKATPRLQRRASPPRPMRWMPPPASAWWGCCRRGACLQAQQTVDRLLRRWPATAALHALRGTPLRPSARRARPSAALRRALNSTRPTPRRGCRSFGCASRAV